MQVYEKYQQLARDAASSGDRIAAENLLQHAEHYYRLMVAAGMRANENRDIDGEGGRDNGDRRFDGRLDDRGSDASYQQHQPSSGAEARDSDDSGDERGDDRAAEAKADTGGDDSPRRSRGASSGANGTGAESERPQEAAEDESVERPPRRRRTRRPPAEENGDAPVAAVEPTQA